jgi:hypothetical protein
MNFSIPDEVKDKFNELFEGQNKSAVITRLMIQAIEENERERRSRNLVARLRAIREQGEPIASEDIAHARRELRE